MTTTTATTPTQDEAQIRQLISDQTHAICTKDLDQIMAHYASDIVIFDVKPPFQIRGAAACRQMWETSLPCMPTSSGTEMRDLSISISGDLALAHWMSHFTGIDPVSPAAQMWLRITAACQRQPDGWQIIHEHVSVPSDPDTTQAVFTLNAE